MLTTRREELVMPNCVVYPTPGSRLLSKNQFRYSVSDAVWIIGIRWEVEGHPTTTRTRASARSNKIVWISNTFLSSKCKSLKSSCLHGDDLEPCKYNTDEQWLRAVQCCGNSSWIGVSSFRKSALAHFRESQIQKQFELYLSFESKKERRIEKVASRDDSKTTLFNQDLIQNLI